VDSSIQIVLQKIVKGTISARSIISIGESSITTRWLPTVGGICVSNEPLSYASKEEAHTAALAAKANAKIQLARLREANYRPDARVVTFWSDGLSTRAHNILRHHLDFDDFFIVDSEDVVNKLRAKGFRLNQIGIGKVIRQEIVDALGDWAVEQLE